MALSLRSLWAMIVREQQSVAEQYRFPIYVVVKTIYLANNEFSVINIQFIEERRFINFADMALSMKSIWAMIVRQQQLTSHLPPEEPMEVDPPEGTAYLMVEVECPMEVCDDDVFGEPMDVED